MSKAINYIIWITAIVLAIIFRFIWGEYQWLGVFAYIAFIPFIDLGIKVFFLKQEKPTILTIPFKDFVSPWLVYCGLAGIGLNYWQAQIQHKEQQYNMIIRQQQETAKDFIRYTDDLEHPNEGRRVEAIDRLYKIAHETPSDYLNYLCNVFCSHIINYTNTSSYQDKNKRSPSRDIQKIINLLLKNDRDSLIFDQHWKSLERAYLYGADFSNAILNNVDLSGATLNEAIFKSAKLYTTHFMDAKLDNVNFENAYLENVNFRFIPLISANFKKSNIRVGRFFDTRLTDVNFEGAHIDIANFGHAIMKGVSFKETDLTAVSFRRDSLVNVNFTGAKLNNVDFWNANLMEKVYFTGTSLENKPFNEITCYECSQKLTRPPKTPNPPKDEKK